MVVATSLLLLMFLTVCSVTGKYSVNKGNIDDLETMIISNDMGESVEIVIDFGGRVESLYLKSRDTGVLRNVLLGHHGDAQAIKDNKYWKGMLLMPYANRIAHGKYDFFNDSYVLPLNDDPRSNSLHGFMTDKKMNVLVMNEDDDQGSFTGVIQIINEPGYPFSLNVTVTYTLSHYGFSIQVDATNTNGNGQPLPFYMGWHPYFNCTAYTSYVILDPFNKWNHVELNANMDPTGITRTSTIFNGSLPIGGTLQEPTFYDDEFKAMSGPRQHVGTVDLIDPSTDQMVTLWYDRAFHYIHVFTGSSTVFNEDGIAIEPMSGMADSYNNHDGLTTISDGETWTGKFGVYVK